MITDPPQLVSEMPDMTSYVLISAVAGGVLGFLLSGTLMLVKVLCSRRKKSAKFSADRELSRSSHNLSSDDRQEVGRSKNGGNPDGDRFV